MVTWDKTKLVKEYVSRYLNGMIVIWQNAWVSIQCFFDYPLATQQSSTFFGGGVVQNQRQYIIQVSGLGWVFLFWSQDFSSFFWKMRDLDLLSENHSRPDGLWFYSCYFCDFHEYVHSSFLSSSIYPPITHPFLHPPIHPIHPSIYPFNNYLLIIYCAPDTIVGAG